VRIDGRSLAGFWIVLLLLGVVGSAAVYQIRQRVTTRGAFPQMTGSISVRGVAAPVAVLRDENGIPHVEAAGEVDAFFGLGFVHAQDRLAQMLWLRRVARGRTAEVLGPEGLPADRRARTFDLGGLADREFERLDAETRERVVAYANGVNARIQRIRTGAVRPPVTLLGPVESVEDWLPADSLAVLKLYTWGLADSLEASLVLHDLIVRLGGFGAHRFFPERPRSVDPTARGRVATAPRAGDPLRAAARLRGRTIGSSAWVLGGAQTISGAAILVADAHLEVTAPSLFYVAHFRGGNFDAAGATIPGIPIVWTGRNRRVAWASTNARAATIDLYQERFGESDPDRYLYDGRWHELVTRVETLRVRGAADETLVVRSTHRGPLINDLLETEREPLALAWAGARPDARSGVASFLKIARAGSSAALRRALANHEEPPLAVVYAGRDGAAGMQVAGWIPRRALPTDLVPLTGPTRVYDWMGRVAFGDLPRRRLRAGAGWAIAADAPMTVSPVRDRVEWLWRPGVRAKRIDTLLRSAVAAGPVELRELTRMQSDVALERGRALIAIAIPLGEEGDRLGPAGREIAALLRGWDGWAGAASTGAAVYHVFLERLTRKLLEHVLDEDLLERYLALRQADADQIVFQVLRDAASSDTGAAEWAREAVQTAIRESLRETWFSLSYQLGSNRSRWLWGRLHPLQFYSFLPGADVSRRGVDLGPFAAAGSSASVNAAEYARGESFAVRVGSTFRIAIDASALDEALVTVAPGQSGHPGHPHFADAIERWREGRPMLLSTSALQVEESSIGRLVLEPAP